MLNKNNNRTTEAGVGQTYSHHCICWSAIFIGAFVGVGLGFLLNLFGIAIGLSAFKLTSTGATVMAIGGFIGLLIGIVASMLAAGYTAGYLSRMYAPKRHVAIIYGFTTWTISLILMSLFSMHTGNYVAHYANSVAPAVKTEMSSSTISSDSRDTLSVSPRVGDEQDQASDSTPQSMNMNITPGIMAWGAFVMFVLFFLGAIAACVGAYWSMACCQED